MGRFIGPCILALAETPDNKPLLSDSGRSMWRIWHPYGWQDDAGWTVWFQPPGLTDLASIPRPVWDELPPDGPWTKGAVGHDQFYKLKGDLPRYGHPEPFTREEADKFLDDAMAALGVEAAKRVIIYEAVRVGGVDAWGT